MSRRYVVLAAGPDAAREFDAVAAAAGWRGDDTGRWGDRNGELPDVRLLTRGGTHVRLVEDRLLGELYVETDGGPDQHDAERRLRDGLPVADLDETIAAAAVATTLAGTEADAARAVHRLAILAPAAYADDVFRGFAAAAADRRPAVQLAALTFALRSRWPQCLEPVRALAADGTPEVARLAAQVAGALERIATAG
jgi:hypothetical protein